MFPEGMMRTVRSEKPKAVPPQDERKPTGSSAAKGAPELGARVRELCRTRNLTLRQLSSMTGIPIATLSKVQNNLATLSYVQLTKLAAGLGIELNELFAPNAIDVRTGRRAITRKGSGQRQSARWYNFEMLCSDLAHKKMNTAVMEIKARTPEEAGGLAAHEGEEFAYVLEGAIEVHTEDYRPTRLNAGDAIYMDSTSAHAYVNVGDTPIARVLAVTSHAFVDPREK
jgi:transcriptional regulator with XRE-family HTH domain